MKKKRAEKHPAAPPEQFAIPTGLLVDVLKLVGETPSKHGARLFVELQKLKPVEAA